MIAFLSLSMLQSKPPAEFVCLRDLPTVAAPRGEWQSPAIESNTDWNEVVLSWNFKKPKAFAASFEVRTIYPDHTTRWYSLGNWSDDPNMRTSVNGQKDEDGAVYTDCFRTKRQGGALQIRISWLGAASLDSLCVSFCNREAATTDRTPNKLAWGKLIDAPQKCQGDYPNGGVLCSPTCVCMALGWLGNLATIPDVPEVTSGVMDPAYPGAGNWAFNMAYAGSFPGVRASVRRLSSLGELEDAIAGGQPLICSVSYMLLRGQILDPKKEQGHLVLLVGFTPTGDPIFNDPGVREVRKTYPRADFLKAWEYNRRTVYWIERNP